MKKVLIITYYWPPSGGGGVQRWLYFSKYLPEFGWEPVILTPANPSTLEKDLTLTDQINHHIKIVKIPIWEPYSIISKLLRTQTIPKQGIIETKESLIQSILIWARGNLLIPDTRIFWIKKATTVALGIIKRDRISTIITTGPPHSMHLIGFNIKKKLKIRWMADFRDPWASWDILDQLKLTKAARKKHENLEYKIINHADGVTTVSSSWANEFHKKYRKTIWCLTNGFEPLKDPEISKTTTNKFRISHIGLINKYRFVPEFWDAIDNLCHKDNKFFNELEIFLAGNIDSEVFDLIGKRKFSQKLQHVKYLPHNQLIKEFNNTQVFLLFANRSKNSKGHIPGKVFEYIYYQKPIMAIVDKQSDVAKIISETNSGLVIDSDSSSNSYEKFITDLYDLFKSNKLNLNQKNISKYERYNLTKELAEYLEILNEM